MKKNLYIVRCGEVALKGMNRPYFERILLERVKNAIAAMRMLRPAGRTDLCS